MEIFAVNNTNTLVHTTVLSGNSAFQWGAGMPKYASHMQQGYFQMLVLTCHATRLATIELSRIFSSASTPLI
jgi:hypothetical protein